MSGVYYVVSSSDAPEAIYFSEEEAFAASFEYIDVFDEEGAKVLGYKLISGDSFLQNTCEDDYTLDF